MSAAVASSSLALQTYEPPARDRRVHLDDLSGVLELAILVGGVYALRSLRRRDLSLAQFTHAICMSIFMFVGGHFIEEHMLGVRKLEGLLKFGFQALSEDYSTPPRSGIVSLFRGIWELSGVIVGCGGILYSRLWKCGHPEVCPSCIASHSSISAGQGLAGNGCGPVHLKCRLLRARFYLPIFLTWWCFIIAIIGARFNSLLGGSAIRPANDAYYFLAVLRSSPFIGLATIGATMAVWMMAELLEAEGKPQVNEIFRCLAMEMENDDIMRSLLGQQLKSQSVFSSNSTHRGDRSIHIADSSHTTPIHGSTYSNANQERNISSGSFFVDHDDQRDRTSPPLSGVSFPDLSNTPSWSVPSPNYQQPPASFAQQQRSPPSSSLHSNNAPSSSMPQSNSSGTLNRDFEIRAAQAEAEAFAFARQQSERQSQSSKIAPSSASNPSWSGPLPSPTPPISEGNNSATSGILTSANRGRLPPASAPQRSLQRSMSPSTAHRSMSPSARQRSMSPSTRVAVPASLRKFNRGGGDVSHLISSDSESDDDNDEDRRTHAAMGGGLYEDLGGGPNRTGGFLSKHSGTAWPTSGSSSALSGSTSTLQLQPLSAPKGVLLSRSAGSNSPVLARSPSASSLDFQDSIGPSGPLQPLSSPKLSSSPKAPNHGTSFPDTPTRISLTSTDVSRTQQNGTSSYSPASKQAAIQAANAALQQGGLMSPKQTTNNSVQDSDPTSPITPVNLASRPNFDVDPSSSPRPPSSMSSDPRIRGRPEGRAATSKGPFSDRPVSLTRSNADSSEDDSDDSESESDVSSSDEAAAVVKRSNNGNGVGGPQLLKKQLSGSENNSNTSNLNNQVNSTGSGNIGLPNQSIDVMKKGVQFEHKPPPFSQGDSRQSSSGVSDLSKGSDQSEGEFKTPHQAGLAGDDSSPSSVVNMLAKEGWKRFVDDSSGAAYWFNENSGESSWTKPIPSQK